MKAFARASKPIHHHFAMAGINPQVKITVAISFFVAVNSYQGLWILLILQALKCY